MVDKGPDSQNPLAIFGSGVLAAAATWFWSQLIRKRKRPAVDLDIEGIRADIGTLRSEFRTLKADLKADIGSLEERVDNLQGTVARIIRHGGVSGGGD